MTDTETIAGQPQPNIDRWPSQIRYIIGNEACERFSYYGMKSILAVYITTAFLQGGLGQTKDSSTIIIHLFSAVNYFMPLFGAWLSDKWIGRYHTILWVSLFYCAGHGVLACSELAHDVNGKLACLYAGLGLIAFGSGGIKPCVSAFMGDQFKPEQSHLLQKAYGVFYFTINFGSFFAFLLIPMIRDHKGYGWAFGVPGILMGIATFIFWLGTKKYVRVPPGKDTKSAGFVKVFATAYSNTTHSRFDALVNIVTTLGFPLFIIISLGIFNTAFDLMKKDDAAQVVCTAAVAATVLWYASVLIASFRGKFDLGDGFWNGAKGHFSEKEISGARSVMPILFVFALIPVFWSLFNQTNSTWVLQAGGMVPAIVPLFGGHTFKIGAEEMQSMNALMVLILVPFFTLVVYPLVGKWASPLRRVSCGIFLTSASYLVVAALQRQIETGHQLNVLWQSAPYLVISAAEVLVSTTGLEFAFREAAPELKSTIMSFFLLTITIGDLFVVGITRLLTTPGSGHEESVKTSTFLIYSGVTFVVAILFSLVAMNYKYRDASAAQGK